MNEYTKWAIICESLKNKKINFRVREKEIWWCHWGQNIGHEENGKGERFERPVLILKRINIHLFIGLPLTTKYKGENYKFCLGKINDEYNYALIEQTRTLSVNRLEEKIITLNRKIFYQIQKIVFSK